MFQFSEIHLLVLDNELDGNSQLHCIRKIHGLAKHTVPNIAGEIFYLVSLTRWYTSWQK